MVQIQGEKKECSIFNTSLSIRRFHELKPRIHVSSNGDISVCSSVKENSEMVQEREHKFRGSISLTTNDCIIDIISAYVSVLNNNDMIHDLL